MKFLKLYWRSWLTFCWICFRLTSISSTIKLILKLGFYPRTSAGTDELLRFTHTIMAGFWLADINRCWHRTLVALAVMLNREQHGIIETGARLHEGNWELHIWVSDGQGRNLSDEEQEDFFQPLTQISF